MRHDRKKTQNIKLRYNKGLRAARRKRRLGDRHEDYESKRVRRPRKRLEVRLKGFTGQKGYKRPGSLKK